jgi:Protein of unknown function (DUF2877)
MSLASDHAGEWRGHRSAVEIPILRAGILAQEFCRRGENARVAAVFDRSFYLVSGATFVCVGAPAIGNGPLTLIADLDAGRLSTLGLLPGRPISARRVSIAGAVRLNLDRCAIWCPPPWPVAAPPARLIEACATLARRAADEAPPDGLARAVFGVGALSRIAAPRIAGFEAWLSGALRRDDGIISGAADAVSSLIGLGPGLTPSGDDFLSGVLALLDALDALDALGERKAVLARAIAHAAPALTSPLSACLLSAAAAGHVGERLHDLVSGLVAGDVEAAIAAARTIGHGSGWDMLAGAAMVLRIVAKQPP